MRGSPFLHQHLARLGLCKQLVHPSLLCVKVLPVEGLERKGKAALTPFGQNTLRGQRWWDVEEPCLLGETAQAARGQNAFCPEPTGWLATGHRAPQTQEGELRRWVGSQAPISSWGRSASRGHVLLTGMSESDRSATAWLTRPTEHTSFGTGVSRGPEHPWWCRK